MGWFDRKREVLDLTDKKMQELAAKSGEMVKGSMSEGDVVDLSGTGNVSSESGSVSPNMGFLSGLAGAGQSGSTESSESSTSNEGEGGYGSYTEKLKVARSSRLAEFKTMQVKMDDLEYKLDRMLERIAKLESSITE